MRVFLIYIFLTLFLSVLLHPTRYPSKNFLNVTCNPTNSTNLSDFEYPVAISWHVHITFMLTNKGQIQRADELRDKVRKHFGDHLGPDCKDRYDNTRFCLIYDHPINITLGPFPIGEWSLWVPNTYLGMVIPWMSQNRGEFSLLVHPNTGCEYEDHDKWAFWVGPKWNLDFSIFEEGVPTNEFGHFAGDTFNPTCLANGQNCGSPDYSGPAMACCENSICSCAPRFTNKTGCYCQALGKTNLKYLG